MLTFRLFDNSDEDYKLFVDFEMEQDPKEILTVEEQRYWDQMRDPKYQYERYIVEKDGKPVAVAAWREPHWSYVPGKYYVGLLYPDTRWQEEVADAALDFLLEKINARRPQPELLIGNSREDFPNCTNWYLKHGFTQVMRYPRSQLDVNKFDFTPFQVVENKVREDGFQILSAVDLAEQYSDWTHRWYNLMWEILPDVPQPDALTKEPYEQFIKVLESPNYLPEGLFFARSPEGELVGLTGLWRSPADRTILFTGLTGVKRSLRRKGLATALKVHAIRFACEYGALRVETDNEENNPMYQLNLYLGFKPLPAMLDFEKKLT